MRVKGVVPVVKLFGIIITITIIILGGVVESKPFLSLISQQPKCIQVPNIANEHFIVTIRYNAPGTYRKPNIYHLFYYNIRIYYIILYYIILYYLTV